MTVGISHHFDEVSHAMGTDLRPLVYQLLGMPAADGVADDAHAEVNRYLEVGELIPADSAELVTRIADRRLAQLKQVLDVPGLHWENRAKLQAMLFHTYDDFLLTTKHATPSRSQHVPEGHSLSRPAPDLPGYLAHLATHDPDLAAFFYRRLAARIPEADRAKHTYVLGKSGSGKTELLKLFIHAYLRQPLSTRPTLLVIDPHGDFAEQVAQWRDNLGAGGVAEHLAYIDPFLDPNERMVPTFNPLTLPQPTPHRVDNTAQALVGAFREMLHDTTLSNQMKALLVPCLSVLLTRPGSTLAELMRFMDDDRNEDLVELGTRVDNPSHADFFASGRFYATTYQSTKASLATKLQSLLNSHSFYRLTVGENTFDLGELMDSRKLVVFNLAKGRLGSDTSEAYGRFLLALLQANALGRQALHVTKRVPVQVFIDEFANYISPSMAEILAESRKYKVHMTMAQQFLGQGMDTEFRRAILANTQIKIAGLNSNDTRAALAKEMDTPPEDLGQLHTGQFMVKVGAKPAWKLHAPQFLLGNRHRMSRDDWHQVTHDQFQRYYRDTSLERPECPADAQYGRQTGLPSQQDNMSATGQNIASGRPPTPPAQSKSPQRPKFTFDDDA